MKRRNYYHLALAAALLLAAAAAAPAAEFDRGVQIKVYNGGSYIVLADLQYKDGAAIDTASTPVTAGMTEALADVPAGATPLALILRFVGSDTRYTIPLDRGPACTGESCLVEVSGLWPYTPHYKITP
jgi:hypothetical protein